MVDQVVVGDELVVFELCKNLIDMMRDVLPLFFFRKSMRNKLHSNNINRQNLLILLSNTEVFHNSLFRIDHRHFYVNQIITYWFLEEQVQLQQLVHQLYNHLFRTTTKDRCHLDKCLRVHNCFMISIFYIFFSLDGIGSLCVNRENYSNFIFNEFRCPLSPIFTTNDRYCCGAFQQQYCCSLWERYCSLLRLFFFFRR